MMRPMTRSVYKSRLIARPLKCLLLLIFGAVLCFLCVVYISMSRRSTHDAVVELSLESFNQLANKDDVLHHVDDMQRLQKSIISELSQLEQKRNKLKSAVKVLEDTNRNSDLKLKELESSISQLKVDVKNMIATQRETFSEYASAPLPLSILPDKLNFINPSYKGDCKLENCFDYSRCSVVSGFPIYLYPISTDNNLLIAWKTAIASSRYITNRPDDACVYFLLVSTETNVNVTSLKYWRGDGRNHIIINVDSSTPDYPKSRAMLAQSSFTNSIPADGFDVVLPYMNLQPLGHTNLPLLLPVRKKMLISFHGNAPTDVIDAEKDVIEAMDKLDSSKLSIDIKTRCSKESGCSNKNWCLCDNNKVTNVEQQSIFTIIPNSVRMPSQQFTFRIHMALVNAAIPVILGNFHQLPFSEFIPWGTAVLKLPAQRVTELEYILRNVLEPDIISYKKGGRNILENYLSSVQKIADTLINAVRSRIDIPPLPPPTVNSSHVYDENNPMLTFQARVDHGNEILGPIETPFPSPSYQRNFTSSSMSQHHHWSFSSYLFPHSPWDPVLPTDAKYHGSPYGFRPINGGAGGSGKEFGESLGGNYPREQYTIVILTYDRSELLQQQLAQFNGLPYLNKVVVIWNNPQYPPPMLQWPLIHVPIQVIKAERNSLNNRFLPYKEIETEAVLSMDDDMYLRHDEIVFAFRVWRESRDRVVGFPGRYHAWNINDEKWNYNSNHSCELSMILTGAAFFHKYYMYQYSYFMSQAIRDKVDEFMNCEDLAMNFLVSHITGKPPIKTTSRWTFRCPTCGETSLWTDESHFNERHKCIEFFTQVYGYLPLKYTQFRADSVLFKTRVPEDKSKCFILV